MGNQENMAQQADGFDKNPQILKIIEASPARADQLTKRIKAALRVASACLDNVQTVGGGMQAVINTETQKKLRNCALKVAAVYPDICPIYLNIVAAVHSFDAKAVVDFISGELSAGKDYGKAKKPAAVRDRRLSDAEKQADAEDAEMKALQAAFDNPCRRVAGRSIGQVHITMQVLLMEFPVISYEHSFELLSGNNLLLLPTYLAIESILHTWEKKKKKKQPCGMTINPGQCPSYDPEETPCLPAGCEHETYENDPLVFELLKELKVCRVIRASRDAKRAKVEAMNNTDEPSCIRFSLENGEVAFCHQCFGEFAANNMIHCEGEGHHPFCITCSIENAKKCFSKGCYELGCMRTNICEAGFSRGERAKFLSAAALNTADRLTLESVLVESGLENLDACAFCHFAAEYPPGSDGKVFGCLNPKCSKKTCRLCQLEEHGGIDCEQAAIKDEMLLMRDIAEYYKLSIICDKP